MCIRDRVDGAVGVDGEDLGALLDHLRSLRPLGSRGVKHVKLGVESADLVRSNHPDATVVDVDAGGRVALGRDREDGDGAGRHR